MAIARPVTAEDSLVNKFSSINFVGKCKGHSVLVDCVMAGFAFEQTQQILTDMGYHLPEDQFIAFTSVLNIQMHLDIGDRNIELGPKEAPTTPHPKDACCGSCGTDYASVISNFTCPSCGGR